MDRAFYVDGLSESRFTYGDLMRAVAAVEHAPEVLPWEGNASFFVNLLAAMRDGDSVTVVDGPGDAKRATQAPHPQPLSPEYRGEGSNEFFLGMNMPEASAYGSRGNGGEGSDEAFLEMDTPEASACGSRGGTGARGVMRLF